VRISARGAEAEALPSSRQARVAACSAPAAALRTGTAAVLYPSVGGGPLYTYGAGSMVTAQLEALDIENVFAGTPDRVFEISAEPLLDADPDVLVVLHQEIGRASCRERGETG